MKTIAPIVADASSAGKGERRGIIDLKKQNDTLAVGMFLSFRVHCSRDFRKQSRAMHGKCFALHAFNRKHCECPLAKPFFVSILAALVILVKRVHGKKNHNSCSDLGIPSSNPAYAPYVFSFSLYVLASRPSEILRAG